MAYRYCNYLLLTVVFIAHGLEAVVLNGRFSGHVFNDHVDFSHPLTGEIVRLRSRGQFKTVIDLSKVTGLKRVTCIANKLMFALENSDVASTWIENDVIIGDTTWECQLGLSHAPEKGIFRKIVKLKKINERIVELITTEASFFDIIEHADIFYHHTPANKSRAVNESAVKVVQNHRMKRSGWFDSAKQWTKEKILSSIFPIDWQNRQGLVRGVNYDPTTGRAGGKFGVDMTSSKDIGFEAKENEWFKRERNVETETSTTHTDASVTSKLECVSCYLSFEAAITFELKIRRDSNNNIVFDKYLLQFDAEAKLNYDVKFTMTGEYSIHVQKRLWKAATPKTFTIPIAKQFGISLKVGLGAELWLDAMFEANAEMSVTTGFDSSAKFTVTSQKIGNQPNEIKVTKIFQAPSTHTPRIDFTADATGMLSVYPKIEISTGIAWGISESTFEVTLSAPVAIGIKPKLVMNFELATAMGSAVVGNFEIVLTLDMEYEIRPVRLDLSIVGKQWDWNVISHKTSGELSLMKDPAPLVSEERLTCPVVHRKTCHKPTEPITSRNNNKLKQLANNRIVFSTSDAQYMSENMAVKINRFATFIRKEQGWSTRKLVVKRAWSQSVGGLAAEGNDVILGVSSLSSDSQDTNQATVNTLFRLAECAGFCNVQKSGNDVTVRVKHSVTSASNNYVTSMSRPRENNLRVYELPVGQGDGTIVQCPNGDVAVVDMGSSTSKRGFWGKHHISSFMNVNKIKHIFITHADKDHYSLIASLIKKSANRGSVKLYYSEPFEDALKKVFPGLAYQAVKRCKSTTCPSFNICPGVFVEVIASDLVASTQDKNDRGLVVKLKYSSFSMLFVGDLTSAAAANILIGLGGRIESDVYKLAHHASANSEANTRDFLNQVKPKIVLASGDPWHTYRHPRCSVIQTAIDSSSVLKSSSGGVTFKKQTDFVCGGQSNRDIIQKNGNKAAVYTHAPTIGTLDLIRINFNSLTKSTRVTRKHMLTDSHSTSSGRKKRSDKDDADTMNAGSDMPLLEWCSGLFSPLSPGQSNKGLTSMSDACTPIVYPITRDDERFANLYYYSHGNVLFSNDEQSDTWCGLSGETCPACKEDIDEDTDVMDRCADRVMTFRQAFRLRRLAFFAAQQWEDKMVQVEDAWSEKTSSSKNKWGKFKDGSLHYEGRAAKITLVNGIAGDVAQLSMMAQCAGFDYVKLTTTGQLEVCVLPQEAMVGEMVSFLKDGQLLSVDVPSYLDKEYGYPDALKHETRQTKLFDGVNVNQALSEHYSIADFVCPGKRFFRLDERLVECLEQTRVGFQDFEVITGSAYRTHSTNQRDLETRHSEERFRFQTGQAVELKQSKRSTKFLIDLARKITQACTPIISFKQMTLGVGAHADRLYMDIRTQAAGESKRLTVWEVGSSGWFDDLRTFAVQVNTGGSIIDPVSETRACRVPPLGGDLHYVSVPLDSKRSCSAEEAGFCADTGQYRDKAVKDLIVKLKRIIPLPKTSLDDVMGCLYSNCGCGLGYGSIWEKKVHSCSSFLGYFVNTASVSFSSADKANFYNTDNLNSSVHALACGDGLCLENTQLYSFLKPVLLTTYRPNDKESIEEMLYSARDNPNPAINLLEQIMAMHVTGDVSVFIEFDQDISALVKIIKVLLVYNTNVSSVTFYVTSTANRGKVEEILSRKAEFWATGACPKRSRVAITPYTVVDVPHHRVRRSIELSAARNMRMIDIHQWEHRWLSKN